MEPADDFISGYRVPDPTARLIAFGFYDGATDGPLETRAGRSFRFDYMDEWPEFSSSEPARLFLVRRLADGTVDRVSDLIRPVSCLQTPFWVPSWWHLPPDEKAVLDRKVDAMIDAADDPTWVVAGYLGADQLLTVRPVGGARQLDAAGAAGLLGLDWPSVG